MQTFKLTAKTVLFILLSHFFSSCEREELLTPDSTPTEIKNFISIHYPDQTISTLKREKELFSKHYSVYLSNKSELKFNRDFEIDEIDGYEEIPSALIHSKILNFIKEKHAGQFITGYEKTWRRIKIELSSGLELNFTSSGEFVRKDD